MSVPTVIPKELDSVVTPYIELINDRRQFADMAHSWGGLLKRSGFSNIYLTYDWLYTWWLRFGEQQSHKLSILCVFDQNKLIALAPFYIEIKNAYRVGSKKTLRLLGQNDTISDSEKLDIIADKNPKYEHAVINILADYIKKAKQFSSLVVQGAIRKSYLCKIVDQLKQQKGSAVNINKQAFSLALPSSFEDFIAQQNLRWKSSYRGHTKIMAMSGNTEVRITNKPGDIHAGLQSLAQIVCARQRKLAKGKCSFDVESYMHFHEDICERLSIKGSVEILSLIMDGRLLASACYYCSHDIFQIHQMASIKGDGIHFSPMLLLVAEIIKQGIKQGKTRIEFHSNYACSQSERANSNGNDIALYRLEWHKSRSKAYFIKSARKLYNALNAS